MIAVFNVWDFKDIQKVCSPMLATDDARIALTYMDLEFMDNRCTAYGSNGYQVSKITVPCTMTEKPFEPIKVLLRPIKIPAKTKKIILNTDDSETLYLTFFDKDNGLTGDMSQPVEHAEPLKFEENVFKPSLDKIGSAGNFGEGKYSIVVDPKYLMNALSGMQDCKTVIFNFSDPLSPFLLRPYKDEDFDAMSLVFPCRP